MAYFSRNDVCDKKYGCEPQPTSRIRPVRKRTGIRRLACAARSLATNGSNNPCPRVVILFSFAICVVPHAAINLSFRAYRRQAKCEVATRIRSLAPSSGLEAATSAAGRGGCETVQPKCGEIGR